jgi:phenylalanyl-tRNA synthetase beta subunit
LFGMMGIAREIAGIQGQTFKSPDWYTLRPDGSPSLEADELKLEVTNELPELVPRFTAVVMSGVAVRPSPVWLQVRLSRLGLRPINNIVDLTNYYMVLTGQPLHAYDYDKAIGIGGVMGGGDTEVDESTKNIILECANFDMYSIRRTSMALGLFTDAVTRFTKGQSPLQNLAVLWKIVDDVRSLTGGKVAGTVTDDNHLPKDVQERGSVHPPVTVTAHFINVRLGLQLTAEDMAQLLRNVEFEVVTNDDSLTVKAPFWRTDVEIPEDVVEEVGRLYGYDKLPLELPKRDLTPAPKDPQLVLKSRIRAILSAAGANEVLTYSFVHGNLLDKAEQDRGQTYQLSNALSPDLQYYRLSLLPSLLEKVHPNIKAGYDEFALFEIGKAHVKGINEDGSPKELERLALVFAADSKAASRFAGAPYYQARKYYESLVRHLGLANLHFESLALLSRANVNWDEAIYAYKNLTDNKLTLPDFGEVEARGVILVNRIIENSNFIQVGSGDLSFLPTMIAPFESAHSAIAFSEGNLVGAIGEFKAGVSRALKLPVYCAGFELGPLLLTQSTLSSYATLPRFPKIEQDICLKVPATTPYEVVGNFVMQRVLALKPENSRLSLSTLDIYQRENDTSHKQITFRVNIASYERTLTDVEVAHMLDAVATAAAETLHAEKV